MLLLQKLKFSVAMNINLSMRNGYICKTYTSHTSLQEFYNMQSISSGMCVGLHGLQLEWRGRCYHDQSSMYQLHPLLDWYL